MFPRGRIRRVLADSRARRHDAPEQRLRAPGGLRERAWKPHPEQFRGTSFVSFFFVFFVRVVVVVAIRARVRFVRSGMVGIVGVGARDTVDDIASIALASVSRGDRLEVGVHASAVRLRAHALRVELHAEVRTRDVLQSHDLAPGARARDVSLRDPPIDEQTVVRLCFNRVARLGPRRRAQHAGAFARERRRVHGEAVVARLLETFGNAFEQLALSVVAHGAHDAVRRHARASHLDAVRRRQQLVAEAHAPHGRLCGFVDDVAAHADVSECVRVPGPRGQHDPREQTRFERRNELVPSVSVVFNHDGRRRVRRRDQVKQIVRVRVVVVHEQTQIALVHEPSNRYARYAFVVFVREHLRDRDGCVRGRTNRGRRVGRRVGFARRLAFFSRVFESHLPEPLGDRARVPDQASLGGCGDRAREPLVVAQRRVVRALERGAA